MRVTIIKKTNIVIKFEKVINFKFNKRKKTIKIWWKDKDNMLFTSKEFYLQEIANLIIKGE